MKTFAAIAALATLASAGANDYFSLLAARSASPIHFQPIAATGQHFYIGKKSTAYCPDSVRKQGGCPNKKGAEIHAAFAGGDGYLSLAVVVPGGQQVYIDPATGLLGFTQAHSASMPTGAITDGWNLQENVISGNSGILNNKHNLLACPCAAEGDGVYKIYASIDGVKFSDDCLGFNGIAANQTKAGAWQYV
ncbi:hypothetical protein K431DRAFT_291832 [Polychaeton citri CBS 116435]|uniref:Cell wall protein PhiA n=1 Tax=Polychaeton citri CBS 116435 TaxID=1314669 RepID=A0A9P4QG87_9PEZI|nr:hypothetical protein K431DRAFT_291832 [Polychaeton citri CBS 116435]